MTTIEIFEAVSDDALKECFDIRITVFCQEQGVSRDIELDGLDDICRHYVARLDDGAIGTARTRPLDENCVKFERIAVLKDFRGRNVGRFLMDRALEDAASDGFLTGVLHAQSYAGPFYEKLGFRQEGDGFEEAGIPHIRMIRPL